MLWRSPKRPVQHLGPMPQALLFIRERSSRGSGTQQCIHSQPSQEPNLVDLYELPFQAGLCQPSGYSGHIHCSRRCNLMT
jgi:hypothetical protein